MVSEARSNGIRDGQRRYMHAEGKLNSDDFIKITSLLPINGIFL